MKLVTVAQLRSLSERLASIPGHKIPKEAFNAVATIRLEDLYRNPSNGKPTQQALRPEIQVPKVILDLLEANPV